MTVKRGEREGPSRPITPAMRSRRKMGPLHFLADACPPKPSEADMATS